MAAVISLKHRKEKRVKREGNMAVGKEFSHWRGTAGWRRWNEAEMKKGLLGTWEGWGKRTWEGKS